MEEKKIQAKQEKPIEKKKEYTPPTITKYGKLTELTAGGTRNAPETNPNPPQRRP